MRSHRRTPTGIRVRHSRSCATSHGQQRCSCSPGYEAFVYSPAMARRSAASSRPSPPPELET